VPFVLRKGRDASFLPLHVENKAGNWNSGVKKGTTGMASSHAKSTHPVPSMPLYDWMEMETNT
jgi:hypothetical protein